MIAPPSRTLSRRSGPSSSRPLLNAATLHRDVPLAPASIATVYGAGLASTSAGTSGTSVVVRDQFGAEAEAGRLYVSPGQINFVLPGGDALGNAILKVMRASQLAGSVPIVLTAVAPGIFTANGKETRPAAAMVVYAAADGSQTMAAAFTCRTAGDCDTAPGLRALGIHRFSGGFRLL